MREVMARYGARALSVTGEVPGVDPNDALPSPFLRAVFAGEVPAWLEVVARTASVVVLKPRASLAAPAPSGSPPPSAASPVGVAAGAEQPAP